MPSISDKFTKSISEKLVRAGELQRDAHSGAMPLTMVKDLDEVESAGLLYSFARRKLWMMNKYDAMGGGKTTNLSTIVKYYFEERLALLQCIRMFLEIGTRSCRPGCVRVMNGL